MSKARTFAELVPDLLGARGLTGVPPEIAIFHLRDTAIELCARSHIWMQTLSIDAQEGVSDYPIELDDNAMLISVRAVIVGCCRVMPGRTIDRLDSCGCHMFNVVGNHTLTVPESAQDKEQGIRLEVTVKPSRDSCNFPDELYEDWADVIADGAAAKCFAMSSTEWYNQGMVTFYSNKFRVGLTRAKNQAVTGRTSAPLLMRGARF